MSIYLFSRPVQSGKTTELAAWARCQNNVAGILMPDQLGKRWMLDLNANLSFEATCNDAKIPEDELYSIGKFKFYKSAFDTANQILLTAFAQNPAWLIIDEVGKLELQGIGFYSSLIKMIAYYDTANTEKNLLLVVRDGLQESVPLFFGIKNYLVIHQLPITG